MTHCSRPEPTGRGDNRHSPGDSSFPRLRTDGSDYGVCSAQGGVHVRNRTVTDRAAIPHDRRDRQTKDDRFRCIFQGGMVNTYLSFRPGRSRRWFVGRMEAVRQDVGNLLRHHHVCERTRQDTARPIASDLEAGRLQSLARH